MICEFGRRIIFILLLSRRCGARAAGYSIAKPAGLRSALIQKLHSSRMTTLQAINGDAVSGEVANSLRLFVDDKTSAGTLVSSNAVRQPNSTEVKSLIWEYDGCPMVIVIDESKQVNVSLLAQFCGVPIEAVSLVSRERAVQLAGIVVELTPPNMPLMPIKTLSCLILKPK